MSITEKGILGALLWLKRNNCNIKFHLYGGQNVSGGEYVIPFRHGATRAEDFEFQDLIEATDELKRRMEYDRSVI